ncbi:cysteine desulfurase [Candidatus Peregrinibacteria bacterium]|jgi:cysteine desulfurase / selenocysteine lyase|nr:cysteine desulfurase [Candidatus Peregrinibacteria bacterium]
MTFDPKTIRQKFPILERKMNGHPLVYFDNASTTQKPLSVINAVSDYYKNHNANVHRGVHTLSQNSTDLYEGARKTVANFINADPKEIVFTSGTTEAINLVAMTFGRRNILKEDEMIISVAEHHSNLVPWQMLSALTGMTIRVIPVTDKGEFDIEAYKNLLSEKTRLVAITHMSNTLGTINPIKEIIKLAHENNTLVLIDGAQATPHINLDMQDLNADFYCFSGHKMYGPTGIGVLYGKDEILSEMIPYKGGGDMIERVTLERSDYKNSPYKFEAGTPNIAGAIGLAEAIKFLQETSLQEIQKHENELLEHATKELQKIEGIRIIGEAKNKGPVLSFTAHNPKTSASIHPYDIGTLLDKYGIAVRTGQHCTEPLMDYFKIPGTVRISFACYNTLEEIDTFIEALKKNLALLS